MSPQKGCRKWVEVVGDTGVMVVENRVEVFRKGRFMIAIMGLRDGTGCSEDRLYGLEMAKGMPGYSGAQAGAFDSYCSASNELDRTWY